MMWVAFFSPWVPPKGPPHHRPLLSAVSHGAANHDENLPLPSITGGIMSSFHFRLLPAAVQVLEFMLLLHGVGNASHLSSFLKLSVLPCLCAARDSAVSSGRCRIFWKGSPHNFATFPSPIVRFFYHFFSVRASLCSRQFSLST